MSLANAHTKFQPISKNIRKNIPTHPLHLFHTRSNKLYLTAQLGASLILVVCLFFFWFVIVAARTGSAGDALLLRLMGIFVLFLLITSSAALYVLRKQTASAQYRWGERGYWGHRRQQGGVEGEDS